MADITDANFDQVVTKSTTLVLVDFWAPWCAPCRIIGPIVEELAKDYAGKLTVVKMNVDDNSQTAAKFGIMSIPTLMIFKGGAPVKTIIGAQGKEAIKKGIDEAIAS